MDLASHEFPHRKGAGSSGGRGRLERVAVSAVDLAVVHPILVVAIAQLERSLANRTKTFDNSFDARLSGRMKLAAQFNGKWSNSQLRAVPTASVAKPWPQKG